MSLLVVVDIDGTISDATHRIAKAGLAPSLGDPKIYKRWVDKINAGMREDEPVVGMNALCWGLSEKCHLTYLTNREEKHRSETVFWLCANGFPNSESVVMRPNGTYTSTADYKGAAIETIRQSVGAFAVIVIDDDQDGSIEALCKAKGYTFLKARSGGAP